jgi:hypothetical protein
MVSDEAASSRQLIDKDQIIDLVHEYSYCVDHRRYDEVVELFTTSHHNANVLVVLDGADRASVRTSVYAWHQRSDGVTPRVWGYYHDTVVRLPEGWRIAYRQLRVMGVEDWQMEMHPAVDADEE